MRYATAGLLLVHGLLHLIGFVKPWRLDGFHGVGVLWLIAAVVLTTSALLCVRDRESWWMVAAPAIVLSQALVVLQWQEAWAGTAVNLVLAVAVASGAGMQQFHADNLTRARALLAKAPAGEPPILRADEISDLPPPVRRWLEASGAVGHPRARTVRLLQRGGLRTAPGQPYMPAAATQYFVVDEPGFVWTVDVTMMRVVPVVGRDSYVDGLGHMFIKAAGLVPVADGIGPTFDQGTALRFLGETIWFPSAVLAPYIAWEPIDERRATATLAFKGVTVSAVFEFDDRGRFAGLTAKRYYNGQSLETWVIPVTDWKTIRGIEIPARGGAVWKLASGDFDYYQWEILDVEVNRATPWGED
jgi:hypothetical protein